MLHRCLGENPQRQGPIQQTVRANLPKNLVYQEEADQLKRLKSTTINLGHEELTNSIFARNKDKCRRSLRFAKKRASGVYWVNSSNGTHTVEIENELLRPIAAGTEVKRYANPRVENYLLYPYEYSTGDAKLLPENEFKKEFPKGWHYIASHEDRLRSRERGKFDDDNWYCFSRPQNMDKQICPSSWLQELLQNSGLDLMQMERCRRWEVVFIPLSP